MTTGPAFMVHIFLTYGNQAVVTEWLLEELMRSVLNTTAFFESMVPLFVRCLKYYFYKCSTALKVFSDTFHALD